MQTNLIRIGTRQSQLAEWQAGLVKNELEANGYRAELVFIKSEGDLDLVTPLYAMGVQGVFTRSLDIALLNNKIDIAVHSMKDVPVQLPQGISQAAVLKRASYKDIFVYNKNLTDETIAQIQKGEKLNTTEAVSIATSSIRRKAQWLHRYPNTKIENLRGNVNTRLKKLAERNWHGAIFAAAGLERINVRPTNSIDLDWMLPAPAQGAIMVVARTEDTHSLKACAVLNNSDTALCVKIERDFLSALMGGCATPISALATIENNQLSFIGNIVSPDGKEKWEVKKKTTINNAAQLGEIAAIELINKGGQEILMNFKNG